MTDAVNFSIKDLANIYYELKCLIRAHIRSDLKNVSGIHTYNELNAAAAEKCMPTSLYTFLKWVVSSSNEDVMKNARGDNDLQRCIIYTGTTTVFQASGKNTDSKTW